MSTRIRALSSLFLVTLVALLAFASPASAKRASTKIVFSSSAPYVHGSLRSSRDDCKSGRTIKVYFYFDKSSAVELIKVGKSDGSGKWEVEVGIEAGVPTSGFYYARTPATEHCRPSKSAVIKF